MTTNNNNSNIIQVVDLYKNFGKLEVLKGITTEIKVGEVVVVIGPSGSGKSTFRCLNYLKPHLGDIIFNGEVITEDQS